MKRIKYWIISILLLFSSFFISLNLYSCGFNNNKVFFANFESYMSQNVMKQMDSEFNIDFQTYKTNEQVLREFSLYDIAIPSTYAIIELIKNQEIEKINWGNFNIKLELSGEVITTAEQAMQLFIPELHPIFKSTDLNGDDIINDEDNLLNYAVPYFFQDFIVGYKSKIACLTKEDGYLNWNDIMIAIQNSFKINPKFNKAISIDDSRTLFSLGKLIQNKDADVNPLPKESSISDFDIVYNYLKKYFDGNQIIFNSDSGIVLNDLANPKGSDLGFMYNGDVLYAMQGGDSGYENDISFIRPQSGSNIALDMIVINKNSRIPKDKLYKIVKKIGLEYSGNINVEKTSIPYQNFDFIQYTTPIKNLYDYVVNPNDGYFKEELDKKKLIDVFKIISINPNKKIEKSISDIQKSNMLLSYLFTKSKI